MFPIFKEIEINLSQLERPSFAPYVTDRKTNLVNATQPLFAENFSLTLMRESIGKTNLDLTTKTIHEQIRCVDVRDGKIEIGIFSPTTTHKKPVIYFIHGGGFIAGNFFQYRNQCKLMAERADAVVITCNYRLAPENPYPTNLNDCYEIYQWIMTHADTLNIDVEKFYIVGDSAGAGIAISLCLQEELSIKRLFNLYGCVDLLPTSNENYPFTIDSFPIISAHKELLGNKLAKFYHQLNLFIELYLQNNEDFKDPLISPVYATDFSKLPPMVYFEAEFDYFRPSNRYFCELAKEVNIEIYSYRGMDHGFFESLGYADEAEDVINRISEIVRTTN